MISFMVVLVRQLGMAGKLLFPIPERGLKDRLYRIGASTTLIWARATGSSHPATPSCFSKALRTAKRCKWKRPGTCST